MATRSLDQIFRQGVEWIAANAYTLESKAYDVAQSQHVQLLAELTDTDPMWVVQCVDRRARNQPF